MLNQKQEEAFNSFQTGQNIFITGYGGVGKTYLIKYIKQYCENNNINIAITSTTGVSAVLCGGRTIHSWANVFLGRETKEELVTRIKRNYIARSRWVSTQVLVIDEISMLDFDLFDKLNYIGINLRKNDRPFGGLQLIFSGDFAQLPPVKCKKFVFESPLWSMVDKTILLTDIFRQSNLEFQTLLGEVRLGICSPRTEEILRERMEVKLTKSGIKPTKLYSTNRDVESINTFKLKELKKTNKSHVYYEKFSTSKEVDDYQKQKLFKQVKASVPCISELELCVGAQVMYLTNLDFDNEIVNGSRGVVSDFFECDGVTYPRVKFLNCEIDVRPNSWNMKLEDIECTISQIPLKLAYALTIHKCQGMTLDSALLNLGSSIFENGQAYTALSRVRDLSSLKLVAFDRKSIKAHPKVIEYYSNL